MNTNNVEPTPEDFENVTEVNLLNLSKITINQFMERWKETLDSLEYDPDQYPKMFAHDVKMMKRQIVLDDAKEKGLLNEV